MHFSRLGVVAFGVRSEHNERLDFFTVPLEDFSPPKADAAIARPYNGKRLAREAS